MTEPTPTPEGEEVSAPEPEATADESMLDDRAKAALQKARREARSLRERLHATEEQVGQLQSQVGEQAAIVSAMQLAEIKRLAGDLLHDPDDLIAHQPDMSNYFDEEFTGIVSADRVVEQAKELIRQRPHLGKPPQVAPPPPTDRPIEGLKPGATPDTKPSAPVGWSAVIHG